MPDNKEHKADKEISVWQKIEEILKEPSYKIAWKFDEAKKIDVKVNFKQFCIRKWAMERKIDLSSYKDSEITNNDFLKIGRKAVDDNKLQNDKDESEVDTTGKQNCIENLIAQSYVQKTSKEEEKHE